MRVTSRGNNNQNIEAGNEVEVVVWAFRDSGFENSEELPPTPPPPPNSVDIVVGVKQMKTVDRIVSKFFSSEFHVMIFHYDGSVDEWRAFPWYDRAIHVSAKDKTTWWLRRGSCTPDIVSEYNFFFLWDEDLGVENFHPKRYLDTVMKEEREIC